MLDGAGDARAHRHRTITVSGLYTPGTVMLQPAGFVRGVAAGLASRVAIYEESGGDRDASASGPPGGRARPAAVSPPRGSSSTVNGHAESFGYFAGRLMQLFLFAVHDAGSTPTRWRGSAASPAGASRRRTRWARRCAGSTAVQGGDRIVTRTCAALMIPGMQAGAGDMARCGEGRMRRKFDARFPHAGRDRDGISLGAGTCACRWNGVAVMRRDRRWCVLGLRQNGLGTARGTLTGIGAADLACEGDKRRDRAFRRRRPTETPAAAPAERYRRQC
jgi:hypothetical protein